MRHMLERSRKRPVNSGEKAIYDIITSIPRCDGAADIVDIHTAVKEIRLVLDAARDHWKQVDDANIQHIRFLQGHSRDLTDELEQVRIEIESLNDQLEEKNEQLGGIH